MVVAEGALQSLGQLARVHVAPEGLQRGQYLHLWMNEAVRRRRESSPETNGEGPAQIPVQHHISPWEGLERCSEQGVFFGSFDQSFEMDPGYGMAHIGAHITATAKSAFKAGITTQLQNLALSPCRCPGLCSPGQVVQVAGEWMPSLLGGALC